MPAVVVTMNRVVKVSDTSARVITAGLDYMRRSQYDADGSGVVDDAERLGGLLPSGYAPAAHDHPRLTLSGQTGGTVGKFVRLTATANTWVDAANTDAATSLAFVGYRLDANTVQIGGHVVLAGLTAGQPAYLGGAAGSYTQSVPTPGGGVTVVPLGQATSTGLLLNPAPPPPVSSITSLTYASAGTFNWTAPAGVTLVFFTGVAGGGGGGGAYSGAGQQNTAGQGGNTAFAGLLTLGGGNGGLAPASASASAAGGSVASSSTTAVTGGGTGGASGNGSASSVNPSGGQTMNPVYYFTGYGTGVGQPGSGFGGGGGGSSLFGTGSNGAQTTSSAQPALPAGFGAGGGGGGSGSALRAGGGGGAAGAAVLRMPIAVTPGSTYAITVGAGGGAGTNTSNSAFSGGSGGPGFARLEW